MQLDAVPITTSEPSPKSSRLPAFLFHSPLVVRSRLQIAFEDVWDLEAAGAGTCHLEVTFGDGTAPAPLCAGPNADLFV
jgi:hypothetical protein